MGNRTRPCIVLHPGEVSSIHDNDIHYIDAPTLARLYNVRLQDCRVVKQSDLDSINGYDMHVDDVHLYPRRDGRYSNYREHFSGK